MHWECDQNQKIKCQACVHMMNNKVIRRVGEHYHAGNSAGVDKGRECYEEDGEINSEHSTQNCYWWLYPAFMCGSWSDTFKNTQKEYP